MAIVTQDWWGISCANDRGIFVDRGLRSASGADRARWLAELSDALEQAHALMWRLGIGDGGGSAAMELYLRIEAARLEVKALQLGRRNRSFEESDPEWTHSSPWRRNGSGH